MSDESLRAVDRLFEACTLCCGPVGDDYHLIRGGAGGVACGSCRDEGNAQSAVVTPDDNKSRFIVAAACDAELCPNWTGQGCICDVLGLR